MSNSKVARAQIFAANQKIENEPSGEVLAAFVTGAEVVGNFSGVMVRDLADKKLSFAESLEIVLLTPAVVNAIRAIVPKLRSWFRLSDENQKLVITGFAEAFDIPNNEAEEVIEVLVSTATVFAGSFDKMIAALRKFNAVIIKKTPAVKTASAPANTEAPAPPVKK